MCIVNKVSLMFQLPWQKSKCLHLQLKCVHQMNFNKKKITLPFLEKQFPNVNIKWKLWIRVYRHQNYLWFHIESTYRHHVYNLNNNCDKTINICTCFFFTAGNAGSIAYQYFLLLYYSKPSQVCIKHNVNVNVRRSTLRCYAVHVEM